MIVSKPRANTLISFIFFLIITIAVLALNISSIVTTATPAWYNYATIALLAPVGLFVLYRIFIRYKIISAGNNGLEIRFPVMGRKRRYPIEEVVSWRENAVRTGKNSVYRELEVLFADQKKLTLGNQEHTEYDKLLQYLVKKAAKKRVKV